VENILKAFEIRGREPVRRVLQISKITLMVDSALNCNSNCENKKGNPFKKQELIFRAW
jgi:hypothetical protein